MMNYLRNMSFKPYYKWNTFNTAEGVFDIINVYTVLNLIINGIPSILLRKSDNTFLGTDVLNLIINGIPSIPTQQVLSRIIMI